MKTAEKGLSFGLLLMLAMLGFIFGGPGLYTCGKITGYNSAVEQYLEACPAVTERLGKPVALQMLKLGCSGGNYESGRHGGEGRAWATMPVAGPNGRAEVDYVMQKTSGIWFAERLVVRWPDGSMSDVKACVSSWEAARSNEAQTAGFRTSCEQGDSQSCFVLYHLLSAQGRGEEGRSYLERACRLGLKAACETGP